MKQIIIVANDRPRLIAEISRLLAQSHVNIHSIDGYVVGSDAILSLKVDDSSLAFKILSEAAYRVVSDEVVAFIVEDVPGALAVVAQELTGHGVDIRGIRTINRSSGHCIVAIDTDNNARVRELLKSALLVSGEKFDDLRKI